MKTYVHSLVSLACLDILRYFASVEGILISQHSAPIRPFPLHDRCERYDLYFSTGVMAQH